MRGSPSAPARFPSSSPSSAFGTFSPAARGRRDSARYTRRERRHRPPHLPTFSSPAARGRRDSIWYTRTDGDIDHPPAFGTFSPAARGRRDSVGQSGHIVHHAPPQPLPLSPVYLSLMDHFSGLQL